jgi:hypothetical protein
VIIYGGAWSFKYAGSLIHNLPNELGKYRTNALRLTAAEKSVLTSSITALDPIKIIRILNHEKN